MSDAEASPTDPFRAVSARRERVTRWTARVALVWFAVYLAYRIAFTLGGVSPVAAGFLLTAEALGLGVFALRVHSAAAPPLQTADVPDAPRPSVTAVIDASGASVDALRTTLVSCRRVEGLERVLVIDTEGSRWLRTIAERFDVTVLDPTVDATTALIDANAMWVLMLDAGDLPAPDLLDLAATVCSAPDVGIAQMGVEEADPSSYEHDPTGRWSLAPFEYQVVRPSLASRGSIPWYGDGPALVRPAAVRDAADHRSTVALGRHAIAAGYRVTMIPRTLARVRGPQTLGESLAKRARTRRSLRHAARGSLSELPRPARHAHRLGLLARLGAVQRVLLVAAGVAILGFGRIPLTADGLGLVVIAGLAYGLKWIAHLLLGRGRLGPFSILRADLRTIGVDVPFGDRPALDDRPRRLSLLASLAVALDIAIFVAAFGAWRDWDGRLAGTTIAVALVVAAGFLGLTIEVLLDALMRRQRRLNHRVRLGLVTCRLEELDGRLADLSTGGAGVLIDAPLAEVPEPGTVTTVAFRIPDASGAWRNVSALVQIAHVAPAGAEATRVGLAFDDPTDAPLDPVVEFLTIDRRLVAFGRRNRETVAGG